MEINFKGMDKLSSAKELLGKEANMNVIPSLQEIISKGRNELAGMVERMVPENGKFFKVGVTFDIPDTFNEAVVTVMHDAQEPKDLRRLVVGMHNQNSDKMFSMHTKKGTKKEILEYLNKADCEAEILEQIKSLTKTMEEHYSSL